MGQCPCARCCTPKDKISDMGTEFDMKRRDKFKRADTEEHRTTIERVRGWIFAKGYGVASDDVEETLQPTSMFPVQVSDMHLPCLLTTVVERFL
jgi:hypothetical protein